MSVVADGVAWTTVADHVSPPAWHRFAACLGRTGLFYAADELSQRIALEVCRSCGVREACLAEALEEEADGAYVYVFGVRGGMTASQRRAIVSV